MGQIHGELEGRGVEMSPVGQTSFSLVKTTVPALKMGV